MKIQPRSAISRIAEHTRGCIEKKIWISFPISDIPWHFSIRAALNGARRGAYSKMPSDIHRCGRTYIRIRVHNTYKPHIIHITVTCHSYKTNMTTMILLSKIVQGVNHAIKIFLSFRLINDCTLLSVNPIVADSSDACFNSDQSQSCLQIFSRFFLLCDTQICKFDVTL